MRRKLMPFVGVTLLGFTLLVATFNGIPCITWTRNEKLVEPPSNEAFRLLSHQATADAIIEAIRRDRPACDSFCFQGGGLLECAVDERRVDVVRAMLDIGFSPDACGSCTGAEFHPPLTTAILLKQPEIVKLLLDHGADLHLAARFSFSVLGSEAKDALYYAESCGNDEIKAMIARAVQDRASTSSKPSETGR